MSDDGTSADEMPVARAARPFFAPPGGSPGLSFLGMLQQVRVPGEATGRRFSLVESEARRGDASPFHVHRAADETFIVLEGALRISVDGTEYDAVEGAIAVLPPGVPHGFVVVSDRARYLTLHHPSGFEEFLRRADSHPVLPGARTSEEALAEVAEQFGIEITGPPMHP